MGFQDTRKLTYQTLTIDLTAAQTDAEYKLPGFFDHLAIVYLDGTVSIRLNEKTKDLINCAYIDTLDSQVFDRIFVTNTAQAGRSLILEIGGDASFKVKPTGSLSISHEDHGSLGPQVTTNAYVTLGAALSYQGHNKMTLQLVESGAQNTMYSIDGSNDNTNWTNLMTNKDLAASSTAYETLSDLWMYVRIRIIDKVGGTHGTVTMYYEAQKM
jgi:hypothetical protein